ncbi:MAG: hypothetical protein HEEMFOPI_01852 [Holosporales bacterium]
MGDAQGDTPAHIAASLNNTGIMRLLIEKNVDLSKKNNDQNSPLHIAMQAGHKEMVEQLINNVDPKMLQEENGRGKTPLMLAVENGHIVLASQIFQTQKRDNDSICKILLTVVRSNNVAFFSFLINQGIALTHNEIIDLLWHAITCDQVEIAEKLINFESSDRDYIINLYNKSIKLALSHKSTKFLKAMIEKGFHIHYNIRSLEDFEFLRQFQPEFNIKAVLSLRAPVSVPVATPETQQTPEEVLMIETTSETLQTPEEVLMIETTPETLQTPAPAVPAPEEISTATKHPTSNSNKKARRGIKG